MYFLLALIFPDAHWVREISQRGLWGANMLLFLLLSIQLAAGQMVPGLSGIRKIIRSCTLFPTFYNWCKPAWATTTAAPQRSPAPRATETATPATTARRGSTVGRTTAWRRSPSTWSMLSTPETTAASGVSGTICNNRYVRFLLHWKWKMLNQQ